MGEIFRVDLDEIEWDFSFPAPRCGEAVFLEDSSGRYFSLLGIPPNITTLLQTA